uniref:PdxS/SNZ N-terminal domain-containing protein n=1 Tax=Oryza nivara TaxID=4536 RepID=A0A0E0IQ56_ORYNI
MGEIRALHNMDDDEVFAYANRIAAPYDLVMQTKQLGRLPVVQFATGNWSHPSLSSLFTSSPISPCLPQPGHKKTALSSAPPAPPTHRRRPSPPPPASLSPSAGVPLPLRIWRPAGGDTAREPEADDPEAISAKGASGGRPRGGLSGARQRRRGGDGGAGGDGAEAATLSSPEAAVPPPCCFGFALGFFDEEEDAAAPPFSLPMARARLSLSPSGQRLLTRRRRQAARSSPGGEAAPGVGLVCFFSASTVGRLQCKKASAAIAPPV